MANINLLTAKIAPKTSAVKASGTLKTIGLIWTIIFFIAIGVMVAISIVYSQQIKASIRTQEQLKSSIKSMEKIEQQYVLLKDRAVKIDGIYAEGNAADELDTFYNLISGLPDGAAVQNMEIVWGKVDTIILFSDSQSLTNSFAILLAQEKYNKIVMGSFTFSPDTGYRTTFTFYSPNLQKNI